MSIHYLNKEQETPCGLGPLRVRCLNEECTTDEDKVSCVECRNVLDKHDTSTLLTRIGNE